MGDTHVHIDIFKAATDFVQTDVGKELALPAAKELGRSFGTILGLVNDLLLPLELVKWKFDILRERLMPEVQRRVAAIPEERRVAPDIAIAGPIIESAAYSVHHDELRDLYAALLANSMDADIASSVHPAFVEIVRQMTPDEARIMSFFSRKTENSYPVINVKSVVKEGKLIARLFSHIGTMAGCIHSEITPQYLDNLIRLGLLEFAGVWCHHRQDELEDDISKDKTQVYLTERFDIRLTDFGDQFCEICAC